MQRWRIVWFAVLGVFGSWGCGGGGGGGNDGQPGTAPNPQPGSSGYSLSVQVSGLHGAERITLTLNGANSVTLSGSVGHTFPGTYTSGAPYRVDVAGTSPSASCKAPPSGQFTGNVTVSVVCTDRSFQVQRVADVNSRYNQAPSSPQFAVQYGARVAFTATSVAGEERLYLTDGTPSGTIAVTDVSLRNPQPLSAFGDLLLFSADAEPGSPGSMNATRGVPGDTTLVAPLIPNSVPVDIGGLVLFFGDEDRGIHGSELWVSDGTLSGSRMVKDIWPGPISSAAGFRIVAMGGRGYFAANDGTGQRLWRSDGTASGTQPVTNANRYVSEIVGAHSGRIYFLARDTSGFNTALWMTDGSPGAEVLAVDFNPLGDELVSCLTSVGSAMYFTVWTPEISVWTAGGDMSDRTLILTDAYDGCGFREFADATYFVAGGDDDSTLWKTDGTAAGTWPVADSVARSFPNLLLPVADRLVFPRTTPDEGMELWSTDGNDLILVLDANPGPASGVQRLMGGVGTGQFVFTALDDGLTGLEPWATDGTSAGTRQLANLGPEVGTGDGVVELLGYTTRGVFFAGCKAQDDCELWITDGTATGTREVADLDVGSTNPAQGIVFNDLLVFRNTLGGPWVSDGTAAGTALIGDSGFQSPSRLNDGFILYAGTQQAGVGSALWRTDGTAAGTIKVSDVDLEDSRSNLFTPFQGMTYFRARQPRGLYRSDGTEAGTALLAEAEIDNQDPGIYTMAALGDLALLFTARDSAGDELWHSDGSDTGTGLLADLFAGPESGAPGQYAAFRNEVYFRARTGPDQWGLWASDGFGVRQVASFPGDALEAPGGLVAADDALYFRARRGLWKSDGTTDGTVPIEWRREGLAVNPTFITPIEGGVLFYASAANGRYPFLAVGDVITQVSDRIRVEQRAPLFVPDGPFAGVYFVAQDGESGLELWVMKPGL